MIIRQEQIEALEAAGKAHFEAELLPYLKKSYPRSVAGVDDTHINRLISEGGRRAGQYGFQARGPVRMFTEFMVLLGHEFDQDPLLYWIQDILRDKEGLDEMTQASRLHLHVSTYRALVYGPAGEHAAKGLERLAKAPLMEELVGVGRAYDSNAIPWLQALHSRKCVYSGAAALQNLLQAAHLSAGKMGLPEPEGPPLALLLMFTFGSGVLTDPLFSWVAPCLAPETSARARVRLERLVAAAQAHLLQRLPNKNMG
ncbi:MAG: hypothetical protein ACLQGV_03275 [Bryobacteraceae bacterium]